MTVQFTNHPSRPLMAPSLPTPRLWRSCNNPANTTASSSCMTLSRPAPTSRRTWSLTDGMRTRMVSTDTILSWRRSKLFGLQKSKRYPCHVPGVFMVNREMTKRLFHRYFLPICVYASEVFPCQAFRLTILKLSIQNLLQYSSSARMQYSIFSITIKQRRQAKSLKL